MPVYLMVSPETEILLPETLVWIVPLYPGDIFNNELTETGASSRYLVISEAVIVVLCLLTVTVKVVCAASQAEVCGAVTVTVDVPMPV